MDDIQLLKQAVVRTAYSWPQLSGPCDPNMIDVYWLSRGLHSQLNLQLDTNLPQKTTGVQVVELVDKDFMSGPLIRCRPGKILATQAEKLVLAIIHQGLLTYRPSESLVTALYTWHGCISMAKCLRRNYVILGGEAPYTTEMRLDGYNQTRACWQSEEGRGNPWVRYGVSLARVLEQGRGNLVNEDWVPKESPYW